MSSFSDYWMNAENDQLLAGKTKALHESPEGGLKTFGYGHKLNVLEKQTRQVHGVNIDEATPEQAAEVALKDIAVYNNALAQRLGPKYEKLSTRGKQMLLDIEMNVGRVDKTFPSLTKAVLNGDLEGQRKEYKRSYKDAKGNRKPLERRNKLYYDRFLSDAALKMWAKGEFQ